MPKPSGCGCCYISFMVGLVALAIFVYLPSGATESALVNQVMGSIFCGDPDAYINESYSESCTSSSQSSNEILWLGDAFYASTSSSGGISSVLKVKCQRPNNEIKDITRTQELTGFGLFLTCITIGVVAFIVIPTPASPSEDTEKVAKTSSNDDNLTNRLRQLEKSYQEGLISKEEYDDARKRLLDNF